MTKLGLFNYALSKIGEYKVTSTTADVPAVNRVNACYNHVRDLVLRSHRWNFARAHKTLKPTWVVPTSLTNSSGKVLVTATAHGLVTGDAVRIKDTSYDGSWVITRVSANTFTLDDSTYSATSAAGSFTQVPPFGYGYQMLIPTDCVMARTVNGVDVSSAQDIWELQGRYLLTDVEEAKFVYTKRVADEGTAGFDPTTSELSFDSDFLEVFATNLALELCLGVTGSEKKRISILSELTTVTLPRAMRNNAIEKFTRVILGQAGNSGYESRNFDTY